MFLSVKERAQQLAQLANGQTPTPTTTAPTTPAKKSSKSSSSKPEPPKPTPSKFSKPEPPKPTPAKTVPPPKVAAPKAAPPPKAPSPKLAPAKPTSSKPVPSRAASAQALPSTPSKRSKSPKSPKADKTEKASSKAPSSSSRPKPSRAKTLPTKLDIGAFDSSSSDDEDSPTRAPTDIDGLKAACLKHASGITGLNGRSLAIVCRQTSAGGWYAALKDVGLDKYLKMWMNRSKTFATQLEALQSYLVFVKKMKAECRLFPLSPKTGSKSK
jgi:hypothetical protein